MGISKVVVEIIQFVKVLLPQVMVTHTALSALINKIDAIYDVTVAYKHDNTTVHNRLPAPTITELFSTKPVEIHVQLSKISVNELNKFRNIKNEFSEETTANWLIDIFEKKDKILKNFYAKNFTDTDRLGHMSKLSLNETVPSLVFFFLSTAGMLSNRLGRKLYWRVYIYGSIFSIFYFKLYSIFRNP
jgi:hypothetical protein